MTRSQGAHAGSKKMPSRTARRGNEGDGGSGYSLFHFRDILHHGHHINTAQPRSKAMSI
jgi:hypothetical protein